MCIRGVNKVKQEIIIIIIIISVIVIYKAIVCNAHSIYDHVI